MTDTDSETFMSLRRTAEAALLILTVLCLTVRAQAAEVEPCRRHGNDGKMISLTFDDGPDGAVTEEILDILCEYGIKATFFVIGVNCEKHPETLGRIASEGHEIGNHTYSHPTLKGITKDSLKDEILKNEETVYEITGKRTELFRPPEGVYSSDISSLMTEMDYTPILWSVDTADWRRPSAQNIVDRVMSGTETGVIILCHDYVAGKSNTPAALRSFIPRLIEQGYKFVTVSELLSS